VQTFKGRGKSVEKDSRVGLWMTTRWKFLLFKGKKRGKGKRLPEVIENLKGQLRLLVKKVKGADC